MPLMIEIIVNDRLGRKVRIKCFETDTIGDLKKLVTSHIGTRAEKLRLQKANLIYKNHITVGDYEIHHGMSVDLYYN